MGLDTADKKWFSERFGNRVKFDEPMSGHTSLRVGGPAEIFVIPETLDEVKVIAEWAWEKKIPYFPIGGGTNLVVTESGVKGVVMRLSKCLNRIVPDRKPMDKINADAGVKLATLCRWAVDSGYAGTGFALGIPGTVGGAIMMNAGTASGCMADIIDAVSIYQPKKGVQIIAKKDLKFSYRSTDLGESCDPKRNGPPIVLSGSFLLSPGNPDELRKEAEQILKERKTREPGRLPSAGCMFKNPDTGSSAGELIDRAGLKGKRRGGAEISTMHANYIVNRGTATADNIISLMDLMKTSVQERFGIKLEPEVRIIGD